ncbi:MAG: site-2 protease family protein [Bryobacterales bacterium]|nr:site-2 protease family protein [Bryobacterales bacterium]MBV9401683.1 site-2 protease family protein [Bryobacterales bacterium]
MSTVSTCPACGSGVPPAASICGRCAHPVAAPPLNPEPKPQPDWIKRLGPFGAIAAAALKFKTAILLVLAKAKFLIFGLAKLKTLLSMLATIGVYWTIYGWRFAAGFVIGIYIHEMGHVWMLRQYGLRASAPMFIPGFGAFVSLYDSPADASQDARIGLAGPLWGAGAAVAFLLPGVAGAGGVWFAIAHATAYINLFNLTPVWMLDGGRAFGALDYRQRLMWLGLAAVLWYMSGSGLFLLLLLGAAYRVFWKKDHAIAADQGAMFQFAGLMILFGAILMMRN